MCPVLTPLVKKQLNNYKECLNSLLQLWSKGLTNWITLNCKINSQISLSERMTACTNLRLMSVCFLAQCCFLVYLILCSTLHSPGWMILLSGNVQGSVFRAGLTTYGHDNNKILFQSLVTLAQIYTDVHLQPVTLLGVSLFCYWKSMLSFFSVSFFFSCSSAMHLTVVRVLGMCLDFVSLFSPHRLFLVLEPWM